MLRSVLAILFVSGSAKAAEPVIAADEAIVITAPFQRNRDTLLSGVSVLAGDELVRDLRPQLGEVLAHQAGVSSTSFGPNASRPILRGFQGERIRVLTDGIGAFDASNTSVDHAVVINPLLAERIEVLRGSAALLYGSSAIGGVVNVLDKRIPRVVPDGPLHVDSIASYGTAADERSLAGVVEVPLSARLVAHFDGSYTKTGDLDIGGFVLTPALRAEAAASADPDIAALADLRGSLPNSQGKTSQFAGGLAFIDDGGELGFAVSRFDSRYGVPIRFSLDPASEAEAVRIDIKQTRVDLRANVNLGGFFEKLSSRFGYADYEHSELEETGEVGTTFFNTGIEGRIELAQTERGGWKGAVGAQLFIRDFDVIGEEAFVPKNETVQIGLFTLQEFDVGSFKAEIGGRVEHTDVSANAIGVARSFTAVSGSLGASAEFADGWRVGLNGSRTERTPAAEELFANGPHAGTQSFEIGDPSFDKETSYGLEAVLRGSGERYNFEASAYYNWFSDYIFERQTGAIEDGLPVFQFEQAKARYYGVEAEASLTVAEVGDYEIVADLLGDYVHARIPGIGPVPRIPPLRLLGGVGASSDRLDGRIEAEWTSKQSRVADFETPTASFTIVNASLTWRPLGDDGRLSLGVAANNIFDVDARRHASFLKDYAPLSGRDFRFTATAHF